jgi:hypothetical protein
VPTGLFLQGHYNHTDYDSGSHPVATGYWGDGGGNTQKPATQWLVQGGISKNWFGYGNTSVYGEYGKEDDWGASDAGRSFAGTSATGACPGANGPCIQTLANFTSVFGVTGTTETLWGLGIVQNFDAAATAVYLGYRHFDADITCSSTGVNCSGAAAPVGTVALQKLQTEGIDVIVMGARVLF